MHSPSGVLSEAAVPVAVMDVRTVRVFMNRLAMRVLVHMRSSRVDTGQVLVLMMQVVVAVPMTVRHRFVDMAMVVVLGDVEPHPDTHQRGRGQQQGRDRIPEYNDRDEDPRKRSNREERCGARRSQRTQG